MSANLSLEDPAWQNSALTHPSKNLSSLDAQHIYQTRFACDAFDELRPRVSPTSNSSLTRPALASCSTLRQYIGMSSKLAIG